MPKRQRTPSYSSPEPADTVKKLQEVEKQRHWANKIHDGDHQRETRGHGTPKPPPKKRKSRG